MARAGQRLDRALDRDVGEAVTIDLDATHVTVYGRRKHGAARSRHGTMSYAPHVATWARRGQRADRRACRRQPREAQRRRVRPDRAPRDRAAARRARPGHAAHRLRVLRRRAAARAAHGAGAVHRVGPAQPGDVGRAHRHPRGRVGRLPGHARRAGRADRLHARRLATRAVGPRSSGAHRFGPARSPSYAAQDG